MKWNSTNKGDFYSLNIKIFNLYLYVYVVSLKNLKSSIYICFAKTIVLNITQDD